MLIEQVVLYRVNLRLKQPFSTSLGSFQDRESIIVELKSEGISGWGEAPTLPFPFYNHEDSSTAFHIMRKYLCPMLIEQQPQNVQFLNKLFKKIIGNNIAKAGIEMAFWDVLAKRENLPLYKLLGGVKNKIESGVVVSQHKNTEDTLAVIAKHLEQGYKRIKLKISPGNDVSLVKLISENFPAIQFAVDANAAYTLKDLPLFKELDQFNLSMIEQPLQNGDLVDHAQLQAQLRTPLCLDESIDSSLDATAGIELKSCRMINIKAARVGGLQEAIAIHDLAFKARIGVWCGGMLETGIGRAHNMAIATLPNFIYANDISESSRYFDQDILETAICFSEPGILTLPEKSGIGFDIQTKRVDAITSHKLLLT